MPIRDIKKGQLAAWIFAGVSAPAAQIVGGMAWQTVLLIGVLCLGTCWCISQINIVLPRWLSIIEYIWLICVLGSIAAWTAESWSSGDVYPWVPLILLALGCVSALRSMENAARAGSVLFWLVLLVYAVVIAAGLGTAERIELSYQAGGVDERLIVTLLIPSLAVFCKKRGAGITAYGLAGVLGVAVLLSLLITSSLSLPVAVNTVMPLHKWVQGLSLAGTVQRFEAIVSMALNMGWFALLGYLVSVEGNIASMARDGVYSKGCVTSAVGAGILVAAKKGIEPVMLVLGCLILWVIVPMILVLIEKKKN